jgi:O-antigen biosynthesis protein
MDRALRRLISYQRRFGWRATLQRLYREYQVRSGAVPPPLMPGLPAPPAGLPAAPEAASVPTVAQWLQARFPALAPIRTYRLPPQAGRRRVTVVTDSIGKGSLFGGVGTALILATLLANRRGADLRIATRTEPPVASSLDHVLQVYGLALQGESQFRFVPADDARQELDLHDDELVITTSWWTTAATLPGVGTRQLVYLLQEDERMFYPHGDDRLRCEQLLRRPDLRIVVNTRLLLDHFIANGFAHFKDHALSFEPAFPERVFRPRPKPAGAKKRFVFYARPNNARNLFFMGIEAIDAAVARGIIDPAGWEILFIGKDIPALSLAGGVEPERRENLAWADYAELVGGADLALSLMDTPHPSYPPLDLAVSGAVVVSNRSGVKQDLSALSHNILLCDLERHALVEGLARGAALAADAAQRQANLRASTLGRDWAQTLEPVLKALQEPR